jgi:hypothetical protein
LFNISNSRRLFSADEVIPCPRIGLISPQSRTIGTVFAQK